MGIYTFDDAVSQLKKRVGNRNDITDAEYGRFINQAQHVMATNVRGIDIFEQHDAYRNVPAGKAGLLIKDPPPEGLGLANFWAFQTVMDTTDETTVRRRLYRGEWEMELNLSLRPTGPPTVWYHNHGYLLFNTTMDKNRHFYVIHRRVPTLGILEIPDEWVEHLINLACTFVYPTIGRNKERDDLFAKMPQNLQIAVLNPMTPSQWEATFDEGIAIYAEH